MKKIIALMLAILMMAAIALPAFAEDGEGEESTEINYSDKTLTLNEAAVGGTVITYGATQSYTVTIPMAISLNNKIAEAEISLSDYSIATTKVLNIYVNSSMAEANYQNKTDAKWYLFEDKALTQTNASDVEYTVSVKRTGEGATNMVVPRDGTTVIASANTVENANTVTETLVFATEGTSQVASFTDTISFTAKIEDPKA